MRLTDLSKLQPIFAGTTSFKKTWLVDCNRLALYVDDSIVQHQQKCYATESHLG